MMARVTLLVVVLACCMVAALGREDAAVLRSNAETQVKALKAKVEQACMPRCTLELVSLPSTAPHLTAPPQPSDDDVFNSNENYAGCTMRDSCGLHNDPPSGWITGPTPWRNEYVPIAGVNL